MQGNLQVSSKKDEFILNRKNAYGTLCHAPFVSMNFSQQGIINACCANRNYDLGKFPDNTLEEIWNGETANNLRKEMDKFSFKLGCDQCELMVNSSNLKALKIPFYNPTTLAPAGDKQSYRNLKYPYRLDFELNNTCNLECIMCVGNYSSSIRKNREKREPYQSPYLSDDFFEQLKPFLLNAKTIGFFGGEPFLISVYFKIFDFLLENNLNTQCYVQTNGTIYSERIKTYLEKLNINLSVSLDAASKDVYEKIRKNAIFERTISNIGKFKEILQKKGAIFYISPVIFTENLFEIKAILDIANKYNAQLYFHHLEFPQKMCLKYVEKEKLKQALDFYYSIEPADLVYSETNSKVACHNVNAFFDLLKYIKYCYTNYEAHNFDGINDLIIELKRDFPDKLKVFKEALLENNLNEEEIFKILIVKPRDALREILVLPMQEFTQKVDQFMYERTSNNR